MKKHFIDIVMRFAYIASNTQLDQKSISAHTIMQHNYPGFSSAAVSALRFKE